MRSVHAIEGMEVSGEMGAILPCFGRFGSCQDAIRDATASLMLCIERVYQVDQFSGFSKTGKQVLFFELLVIVLDKRSNNGCAIGDDLRREVQLRAYPANHLIIGEHDALEEAVLTHEVLIRRNILFLLFMASHKQ